MQGSYVMKVSANGQVSIPAAARARWKADQMLVVDLGDRLVMRPYEPDRAAALDALVEKYAGRGPSSDEARREARAEDADREL